MPDRRTLDAIFLVCKNQADKVGTGKDFLGGGGVIVWALSHEELDISELEGVPLQYSPGHRRKNDVIQVRS